MDWIGAHTHQFNPLVASSPSPSAWLPPHTPCRQRWRAWRADARLTGHVGGPWDTECAVAPVHRTTSKLYEIICMLYCKSPGNKTTKQYMTFCTIYCKLLAKNQNQKIPGNKTTTKLCETFYMLYCKKNCSSLVIKIYEIFCMLYCKPNGSSCQ